MTASSAKEAIGNANKYTSYDQGMCLKWVRGPCWELGSLYGSAVEAWNGAKHKHPGDRNPPDGAPCFYGGGSQGYGHVVIFKSSNMRSTDCTSPGRVGDAALDWPTKQWGLPYLGWTSDLNGVNLPLGSSSNGSGDDMAHYDHGSSKTAQKLAAGKWVPVTWHGSTGEGAFTEGENYVGFTGGRDYSAVLHLTVEAPKGSTIRMRTAEWWGGDKYETNPQTEAVATSGNTYATHAQNGHVNDDRNLKFEVCADSGGTITFADAVVLSW